MRIAILCDFLLPETRDEYLQLVITNLNQDYSVPVLDWEETVGEYQIYPYDKYDIFINLSEGNTIDGGFLLQVPLWGENYTSYSMYKRDESLLALLPLVNEIISKLKAIELRQNDSS